MRSHLPGDAGSLTATGAAARGAARELDVVRERGTAAYTALREAWGTSTSVRTRKQGLAAMAALADGSRQAEVVGAALQDYAASLSEVQARHRRVVDAATAAGLTVEGGRVGLAWGVTGVADRASARESAALIATLQTQLDTIATQHRRRRDHLLAAIAGSTADLATLANALRLA